MIFFSSIVVALKTSPAIHEQRKLLERAKTGDLLKAKIQQRPARQELERRHILESHEGNILELASFSYCNDFISFKVTSIPV